MIQEALQWCADLVNDAKGYRYFKPAAEAPDVYYLAPPGGPAQCMIATPWPRRYVTHTLTGFVDAVGVFRHDRPATVFYAQGQFVCVWDENGQRRDTVSMKFHITHAFEVLEALATTRTYRDQKKFLHLLRIDLSPSFPLNLIDAVRALRFGEKREGESTLKTQTETLGRRIERSVSGAAEFPDSVTLTVPVFEEDANADGFDIRCALDINLEEATFALIPIPGQLSTALRLADERLLVDLRSALPADVEIVAGSYQ